MIYCIECCPLYKVIDSIKQVVSKASWNHFFAELFNHRVSIAINSLVEGVQCIQQLMTKKNVYIQFNSKCMVVS